MTTSAACEGKKDIFYPPYILNVNKISESAEFVYRGKECDPANFNSYNITNTAEKIHTLKGESRNLLYRTTAVAISVFTTLYLMVYKWNASAFLKKAFTPLLNWRYCPSFLSNPQFHAFIFLKVTNKAYTIFNDYITNFKRSLAEKEQELEHWNFVENSSKIFSLELDNENLRLTRKPTLEIQSNDQKNSEKKEASVPQLAFEPIILKKLPWMSAVAPENLTQLEAPLKTLLFSYLFYQKAFDTRFETYRETLEVFEKTDLAVYQRKAFVLLYEALIFKMKAAFALFLLGNPTYKGSLEEIASFNSGKDPESRFINLTLYRRAAPYFYETEHCNLIDLQVTSIPKIALLFQKHVSPLPTVKGSKMEMPTEPATTLDIGLVEKTETQTA